MAKKKLAPIHPGEILREEFLEPLELTPYALAKRLKVPRTRIERLAREEIGISPDTARRLAIAFKTTPLFWLNLQAAYEADLAEDLIDDTYAEIEPLNAA